MDERLTYNVTEEQIAKINSGDRAAMDEFFFSNELRIKHCAWMFMRRNQYYKSVVSWEDLVNEFYVSLSRGLFFFRCCDRSISRCIFHSFRYAAVGGMEDTVYAG